MRKNVGIRVPYNAIHVSALCCELFVHLYMQLGTPYSPTEINCNQLRSTENQLRSIGNQLKSVEFQFAIIIVL